MSRYSGGNIFLQHLVVMNFRLIRIFGVLHAFYYSRFERVSLFEQLLDTLRIRTLNIG